MNTMVNQEGWDDVFQQAALDPSLWLAALRRLADATGSARGQLIGVGGAQVVPFNWVNDFADSALADFVRIGGTSPRLNFRIAADLDGGSAAVVHEADYRRVRPMLAGDSYVEFCHATEIPFGCHTALVSGEDMMVGLAVLRTAADGVTSDAQRATFAAAATAARAAVRLQRAIEHQGVQLVTGTLEAMATACLLIDGFGRVGAMTPAADRALARGHPLAIVDGALTGATPALARRIAQGIAAILSGRASERVALGDGRRLDLFSLPRRDWAMGFAPRLVAVLIDAGAERAAEAATLARDFGLSPAEARIAGMLAGGMHRAAIAVERGVSAETLKSQIRSIFHKTGCTREAELVALMTGRKI